MKIYVYRYKNGKKIGYSASTDRPHGNISLNGIQLDVATIEFDGALLFEEPSQDRILRFFGTLNLGREFDIGAKEDIQDV